jgi:hypothetical protein
MTRPVPPVPPRPPRPPVPPVLVPPVPPTITAGKHDIIIGGKRIALGVRGQPPPTVLTWHEHGISFAPGQGFNRVRKPRARIDLAVWHWTGGEGEPAQVAQTLQTRGYGVEFAISTQGVIWQFVDPLEVDTADAGGVNARSVGTEIVSYGMRSPAIGWRLPTGGAARAIHDERLHGVRVRVASFHAAQLSAARALADGLSRGLGIPRAVPVSADGAVLARAMTAVVLARFSGHVGHYHLTALKCDPGTEFMGGLQRFFDHEDVA